MFLTQNISLTANHIKQDGDTSQCQAQYGLLRLISLLSCHDNIKLLVDYTVVTQNLCFGT